MPKYVRPREGTGVLVHPKTGAVAAPDPSRPVRDDDPLVKAFPWAFVSDEDLAAEQADADQSWRISAIEAARRADAALAVRDQASDVEAATSRPGEKRNTRKK